MGRIIRALVIALGLGLAGCDARSDDAETTSESTGLSADSGGPTIAGAVDWDLLGDSGFVYLQAQTGDKHYEIVRVDLATGQTEQITDRPGPFGISQFSVSPAGLVVADAASLTDEIKVVRSDGSLEPLAPAAGSAPVINGNGDVLAERPTKDGFELGFRQAGTDQWTTVRSTDDDLVSTLWTSDDEFVVIESGPRTTWARWNLDGTSTRPRLLAEGEYFLGGGSVGYGQPVVLASSSGPALMWRPGHRPVELPRGWRSGCVSPDGAGLLLVGGDRLGVLSVRDPSAEVQPIEGIGTHLLACGWVAEEFG